MGETGGRIAVASDMPRPWANRQDPLERDEGMSMPERPGEQAAAAGGGFGGLLRAYRERRLLSQEQLAERSGLSTRAIRNLENGTVRTPRGQSIRLLADALGLVGAQRDRFEEAARSSFPLEPAAASPVTIVPHQLPPDIADFVGRTDLVGKLQELLGSRPGGVGAEPDVPPLVICAVAGKAGVGKSALAVHVAHRLVSVFPDGQLYASLGGGGRQGRRSAGQGLRSPLDPAEILSRFLRALGVDGAAIPGSLEERAALYRSRLAGKRMLVVLDDAADEAQLRPLLPGGPGPAVLITSRGRPAALEGVHLVNLDVLDRDQAIVLLGRIAGSRLAARPHWPLRRMADLLADEHRRLDELAHGDLEVRASLSLSYQGLGEEHRRLFRRLGLLHAPDLPAWVAGALLDRPPTQAEELLEGLVDAQLVDLVRWDAPGQPRYRLHELLHAFARERVQAEEAVEHQQAALERALSGWLALAALADQRLPVGSLVPGRPGAARWQLPPAVADDLLADPLAWFEAERAALMSTIHQASGPDFAGTNGPAVELAWRLAGSVAAFFQLRSYRDHYRLACELALAAARQGGDRRGEAWMLVALAESLADQDRFDQALRLAQQARLLHHEVGDRHGEAYAWFVAAEIHRIRGRLTDAADELRQSWRLYSALGDDQGRAWVLHGLGTVRRVQGRFDEAGALLGQALTASRRAGDRRVEALVFQGLGLLHRSLDQPGQAVGYLLQSLRICRELGDSPGEGYVLRALGDAQLQRGEQKEAAAVLQQALGVFRRIGSRRGEAAVLQSLGELDHAQSRTQQARKSLEAALAIQRELHLLAPLARTLTVLANVQAAAGDRCGAGRSRGEAHRLLQALGLPSGEHPSPPTTPPTCPSPTSRTGSGGRRR
jgi:tetratricopeptide (TPR) repeat protein/transcriptional regulator with XRE-family HTH domain